MTLPGPEVDPYAELPEVTVYGRTWKAEGAALPAPLLTSRDSEALGWCWWPPMALRAQKSAERAGWDTRLGFARGYKPGRGKGTFDLLDTIGLHLHRAGTTGCLMWSRLVDGSYEWKPASAWFRAGGRTAAMGHTEAKRRLVS